jgi:hypothetical protein
MFRLREILRFTLQCQSNKHLKTQLNISIILILNLPGSNLYNDQKRKEDSQLSLPAFLGDGESMKCGVKQLNAIRNFVAEGQYELTVHEGEQLFTDDKNLDKLTWIWVYSARTRQRGFVPRTHVRWAQNTTFL